MNKPKKGTDAFSQSRKGAMDAYAYKLEKCVCPLLGVRVTTDDCGSPGQFVSELLAENGTPLESLEERVRGLVAAAEVLGPDGAVLFPAGRAITRQLLAGIGYHWSDHVRRVPVRSPRACLVKAGVCARCYPARIGAAVGEKAAKSILAAFSKVRDAGARDVVLRAFTGARPARPSVLAAAAGKLTYGRIARGRVEVLIDGTPRGRIRYQPESFWMPREGQVVDAGEVLEFGDEEWLADVRRYAGQAAFHERFLARTQYWFRHFRARVRDADLELWSRRRGSSTI